MCILLNEMIHNKGNYEGMWIKWMPLRYFLAFIFFIFGPPIIAAFALIFWLMAGPVMSYIWAEKSTRYSSSKKFLCCLWPFYLVGLYFIILCVVIVTPILAVLYYLMLIIVTFLILFE